MRRDMAVACALCEGAGGRAAREEGRGIAGSDGDRDLGRVGLLAKPPGLLYAFLATVYRTGVRTAADLTPMHARYTCWRSSGANCSNVARYPVPRTIFHQSSAPLR